MRWLTAWITVAVVFGGLDALWLRWAGPNLYRPALGDLLAPSFRAAPAMVFYAAFVTGLVWFAVRPGSIGGAPLAAALNGAALGALAYATYDLTNQATLRTWPVHVTVVDIAWGAFASAVAAGIGTIVMQRLS
ncbi:DUF2177 family protein [Novosphingobium tardum]|jgi:uncharacterized membrane protein|uniref:DUF2177 family protein n=1 Tax=Novosphingobium tardum TaxID=1538021 RepID=A0ABV8RS43_9SPHN